MLYHCLNFLNVFRNSITVSIFNLSCFSLIKKLKSKLEIIVTFLALLEMIRTAELVCKQKDAFGQIEMKLNIGAEA